MKQSRHLSVRLQRLRRKKVSGQQSQLIMSKSLYRPLWATFKYLSVAFAGLKLNPILHLWPTIKPTARKTWPRLRTKKRWQLRGLPNEFEAGNFPGVGVYNYPRPVGAGF